MDDSDLDPEGNLHRNRDRDADGDPSLRRHAIPNTGGDGDRSTDSVVHPDSDRYPVTDVRIDREDRPDRD